MTLFLLVPRASRLARLCTLLLIAASLAGCGSQAPAAPSAQQPTQPIASATTLAEPSAQPIAPATAQPTAQPASAADTTNSALEERNKAAVLRLYDEVYGKGDDDLLNQLFAPEAPHHHAVPRGAGPAGQRAIISFFQQKDPGLLATVKRVAADGELVAVHWHASSTPDDEMSGRSVVDLFRLAEGTIVEHWYVYQNVPSRTASGNSLFSDLYAYPAAPPALSEDQEQANKELLVSAYKGLFNEHKLELLDQHWDPAYLQHNPFVPNGSASLKGFVSGSPPASLDFFQTISDGDLVWTFVSMGKQLVLTDIFRLADSKIVEHWDIQ